MNYPNDGAAHPWCSNNNAGATAAAVPTSLSGETSRFFAGDMVPDYSIDDLFELVWEQEEGQAGGTSGSMQPAVSCLWSPRFSSKPPDVRFDPPSEDEMAAWLGAVVKSEELACNENDGGGRRPMADDGRRDAVAPPAMGKTATDKKEKVPTTGGTTPMGNKEIRKVPTGRGSSSSRRSHHGEAHNLTEKRRRHKINERLKTLQQLVPGCSKSNQASTLDQTINYMKSLQDQLKAMSVGMAPAPGDVSRRAAAVHASRDAGGHAISSSSSDGPARRPPSVDDDGSLRDDHASQLPQYYPAAAVAPLYPAPAPTRTASVAPGDAMSANNLHGSSSRSSSKERAGAAGVPEWYNLTVTRYDVESGNPK